MRMQQTIRKTEDKNGRDNRKMGGCDPYISTNIFNMNEEKEYYMHIVDLLGQDWPSEFFLDLLKV